MKFGKIQLGLVLLFTSISTLNARAETSLVCSDNTGTLMVRARTGRITRELTFTWSIIKGFSVNENSSEYDVKFEKQEKFDETFGRTQGGLGGPSVPIRESHFLAFIKIARKDGKPLYDQSWSDGGRIATISEWVLCTESTWNSN